MNTQPEKGNSQLPQHREADHEHAFVERPERWQAQLFQQRGNREVRVKRADHQPVRCVRQHAGGKASRDVQGQYPAGNDKRKLDVLHDDVD